MGPIATGEAGEMMYIGIDNGLTGGLVALSDAGPLPPIAKIVMPTQGKAKGQEVDPVAIWEWISSLNTPIENITVVIEKPNNAQTPSVGLSMGDSFGALRAVIALKRLRYHRISPQSWQKVMLPNCEKGNTKPFALSVVKQLWPEENWLASPRCTKPHEGMIDAALICEYARRQKL
jgi:hypothetical protein